MSITSPTDVMVSRESAQMQVDTTCEQIVRCIQMASYCVAKKISPPKSPKNMVDTFYKSDKIKKVIRVSSME